MPSTTLEAMLEAARCAGRGLLQDFANLASLAIDEKSGPADMVSAADLRSEATLRDLLGAAYPSYGFLGEEGGHTGGSDPHNTWVVDPLDGTTNFLVGNPAFAVNVALVRGGEVVAGVTFAPAMGEMFRAEAGGGAFLNDRPIRVSARTQLARCVLGVGIPFAGKPRQEQFHLEMARLLPRVGGIRRIGAGAIDMAYVACGRYDAYWEQSVAPWDLAAGAVLVREAGGLVTDTRGGALRIDNGTVLACTRQMQPVLLEHLRPET
jgi:myo-inositol-1(or 4)-monophosphatase